jgi:hypothetical protein
MSEVLVTPTSSKTEQSTGVYITVPLQYIVRHLEAMFALVATFGYWGAGVRS